MSATTYGVDYDASRISYSAPTVTSENIQHLIPWVNQQENIVKQEEVYVHYPQWHGWIVQIKEAL